jgi:hypothetical protein
MAKRRLGPLALLVTTVASASAFGCLLGNEDDASSDADVVNLPAGSKGLDSTLVLDTGCIASKVGPRHLLVAARCVAGNADIAPGKSLHYSVASAKLVPGNPLATAAPPSDGMSNGQKVFTTRLYPLVQPCASCHLKGIGGAPIYFGEDAASSYALFKAHGYDRASSIYRRKGNHEGRALDVDQLAAADAWVAAEAADAEQPAPAPSSDAADAAADATTSTDATPDAGADASADAGQNARPDAGATAEVKIAKVEINPSYAKKCKDPTTCALGSATGDSDDVAVILLSADLTAVPTIPIDLDAVSEGDTVLALGSGCPTFDGTPTGLSAVPTIAVPGKSALHDGSPYRTNPTLLDSLSANYVLTAGPGWHDSEAKLCKTDLGAPLLRADQAVVVGVASNFTTFKPSPLVPVTVEHTRVDSTSAVGTWLAGLGVKTVKSCNAGCVKHPYDGGIPSPPAASGTDKTGGTGSTGGSGTPPSSGSGTTGPSDGGKDPIVPKDSGPSDSKDPSSSPSPSADNSNSGDGQQTGDPTAGDPDAGAKKPLKQSSSCSATVPGSGTRGQSGGAAATLAMVLGLAVRRRRQRASRT